MDLSLPICEDNLHCKSVKHNPFKLHCGEVNVEKYSKLAWHELYVSVVCITIDIVTCNIWRFGKVKCIRNL